MNYFVTPVSSDQSFDNYEQTVIKGVPLQKLNDLGLHIQTKGDVIHLWGFKADKRIRWNKINKGDILFFYYKKNVRSYCEVLEKYENSKVAEALWGEYQSIYYNPFTWPLIVILSNPKSCNIPFIKFNKIIGYQDHYFLRSFFKLNKVEGYIDKKYHGSVDEFAIKESVKIE